MNQYSEQIEEVRASREMPTLATTLTADYLNRFLDEDKQYIGFYFEIDIYEVFELIEGYFYNGSMTYEEAKPIIKMVIYRYVIKEQINRSEIEVLEYIMKFFNS